MADGQVIADQRARLRVMAERAFGLEHWTLASDVLEPDQVEPEPAPAPEPVPDEADGLQSVGLSARKAPTPMSASVAPQVDLFGKPIVARNDVESDETPFTDAPLPRNQRIELLVAMDDEEVKGCTKCPLCENRTHTVFGEGNPEADLMFVGEGPGENEDLTGRPFVGKAGQKLDEMITAMGLSRERVYIANIVKCRPPGNRAPAAAETAACTPYLHRQIELIRPKVIVTLGLPATQHLLKSKLSMSKLRGQWHSFRGIDVMPTYHPAYLLRSYTLANRKAVWSDLQAAMSRMSRDDVDGGVGRIQS